jgi:hypothetical protein
MKEFKEYLKIKSIQECKGKVVESLGSNTATTGLKQKEGIPIFKIDVIGTKWPTRNDRYWTKKAFRDYAKDDYGEWSGIRSAVHNSGIPMLMHHRSHDSCAGPADNSVLGRVLRSEWLEKEEGDAIVRMYTAVPDPGVAESLRNGLYSDFSIGGYAEDTECTICGGMNGSCGHETGLYYDKENKPYRHVPEGVKAKKAYEKMGRTWLHEFSVVWVPGYVHTGVAGEVGESLNEFSDRITFNEAIECNDGYRIIESASVGDRWDDTGIPIVKRESIMKEEKLETVETQVEVPVEVSVEIDKKEEMKKEGTGFLNKVEKYTRLLAEEMVRILEERGMVIAKETVEAEIIVEKVKEELPELKLNPEAILPEVKQEGLSEIDNKNDKKVTNDKVEKKTIYCLYGDDNLEIEV